MAGRDLVGAECGGDNPMMQMVQHLTQDKTRGQDYGRVGPHQQQVCALV